MGKYINSPTLLGLADNYKKRALLAEEKLKIVEMDLREIRSLVYNGVDPLVDIDQIAQKILEKIK